MADDCALTKTARYLSLQGHGAFENPELRGASAVLGSSEAGLGHESSLGLGSSCRHAPTLRGCPAADIARILPFHEPVECAPLEHCGFLVFADEISRVCQLHEFIGGEWGFGISRR